MISAVSALKEISSYQNSQKKQTDENTNTCTKAIMTNGNNHTAFTPNYVLIIHIFIFCIWT